MAAKSSKKNNGSSSSKTSISKAVRGNKKQDIVVDLNLFNKHLEDQKVLDHAATIAGGVMASRAQHQLSTLNPDDIAAFSLMVARSLHAMKNEDLNSLRKIISIRASKKTT